MMRTLTWPLCVVITVATVVHGQSNPDYPMYHKYVTQDRTFAKCPSGTASIFATLDTGKPMFIMVTGSACGNCSATATSVRAYAQQVAGKVNVWIAWNAFGDNSCSTIETKINEGYPGYTIATHIRDSQYYFGNTYVGEFNLPTFIVIDGATRYVTCMASQDHDGGLNALRIASAACNALLSSTRVIVGEPRVVPKNVDARVQLFDMRGRAFGNGQMSVLLDGLSSAFYTAVAGHNGSGSRVSLTVVHQR